MGLPLVSHPVFTLTLPSTGAVVSFRPFLVKEEKILLVAQSSGDHTDIVRAIKQVISNCLIDKSIDVETFTTFDLEYFFIKLRARSVQNVIELSYRDNSDGLIYNVEVNLDEVEIKQEKIVDNVVKINEDDGFVLKYPQVSIMNVVERIEDATEFGFAITQACIDTIYKGDTIFKTTDFTREEVQEYLDNLPVECYEKIQEFIDAMPRVEHTVSYTNSEGKEVKIVLKTLTDFFTLG